MTSSDTADSSRAFVVILLKSTQPTGKNLLSTNIERYSATRAAECTKHIPASVKLRYLV